MQLSPDGVRLATVDSVSPVTNSKMYEVCNVGDSYSADEKLVVTLDQCYGSTSLYVPPSTRTHTYTHTHTHTQGSKQNKENIEN
jgi:hypothetical protein